MYNESSNQRKRGHKVNSQEKLSKRNMVLIALVMIFFSSLVSLTGLIANGLSSSNVIDQLELLSLDQVNRLQQEMDRLRDTYDLDAVMVITDQLEGKSSRDFADDYYDFNGYGVGEDASGLLMLINMDDREVWISTTGHAIDIFTDNRLDQIIDQVVGHLGEGDFYTAGSIFLANVDNYAQQGVPEGQYREPEPLTFFQKLVRMMLYWPIYVAGLIISGISTFAASSGHRAGSKTSAAFYRPQGSFALLDKKDQFLRETTRRVLIPKNNNTGGGGFSGGGGIGRSSTHTGSSGRSHGGRGGKF